MTRVEEISPRWRPLLAALGLDPLARLLDASLGSDPSTGNWQALTKAGLGGRERWRWELPRDAAGSDVTSQSVVYVKRYRAAGWRAQWDRILRQSPRHSRAYWEYRVACQLAQASVPTPRAVGFVEEMRGTLERRSAVLLERVAGQPLDRTWAQCLAQAAPVTRGAARFDLAARLGRFVAAFHGTGLFHRDLYLCHVFAQLDPAGRTPPELTLIDLARTHRPRWRRGRWLIKDLAQLDASARQVGATRTDRLRVLLAYLGLQRGAPRVRWYARRIVRKSDWILRREARRAARSD